MIFAILQWKLANTQICVYWGEQQEVRQTNWSGDDAGTHLLQTGRVQLRLIDDLYGHLEAERQR